MTNRMRPVLAALALAALLAGSALAAGGGRLPGNRFPPVARTFFLSGESRDETSELRLVPDLPAAGNHAYVLPGLNVLGAVQEPSKQAWATELPWEKDREATQDSVAALYFVANAQALAIFEVRLYDVAPDGTLALVDADQEQFVTALSPTAVPFPLHTAGVQVHKGHVLRLEVYAQTLTAAVVLEFGGDTPSALQGFATRWLDSDGDGVADSDELAQGRNPLNPNDPVASSNDLADTDADGLADRTERTIGTDPRRPDSDGDGFGDGVEVFAGSDPLDAGSAPRDGNHNGLPDTFEATYFNTTIQESDGPCSPGPGCVGPSADPDGDGCDNLCEAAHGTDPNDPDTDGDGVLDGREVADRTDPTSSLSVAGGPRGIPEPVAMAAAFAVGTTVCLLALLRKP
jgi:hypothetical protein